MSRLRMLLACYAITGLMGWALLDAIVLQRMTPAADLALMLSSVVGFIILRAAIDWDGERIGAGGGHEG